MYTQTHTRARQQGYSASDSKYGGSDIKIRSARYPMTDMVLKSMRAAWGWICGAKSPKLNDELIFTLSTGSNWMNYQSCCKTGSDLLDPCHCKRKKQTRVGQSRIWAKSGDVIEIFLHLFSCCRECETLRRQSAMVRARASRVSGLRRYLSTDLQQCSTSKLCTLAHRTAK